MTLENWHFVPCIAERTPGSLIAAFHVPEDSPWFSGHFPEEPILPGVAILAMVVEMIGTLEGDTQGKTGMTGLRRIRFRLPVRPNDTVTMELTREEAERVTRYGFQARLGGEIACTGVVLSERADSG